MSAHRAIPIQTHPNWIIQQMYSEEEMRQALLQAREQLRTMYSQTRYAYWSALQDEYIFNDYGSYNMLHSEHVKVMEP